MKLVHQDKMVPRYSNSLHQLPVRRHRPDYQIVLFMGLLMLFGLIIIYAIGPQRANVLNNAHGTDYYADQYFFIKQIISLVLALIAFGITAIIPCDWIKKYASKVLMIGFGACLVLAIAGWLEWGIAQCSLGACRWFNLGSFTLQPSEILKFGMLVFVAGFLGIRASENKINNWRETLIPLGVLTAVVLLFIVVIQKDLGTGVTLGAIIASMLIIAGLNKRKGSILLALALVIGLSFIFSAGHRVARITTFLQGDDTSLNDSNNYHIEHAKIAIGSGGLVGVGIGNSVQATGYLPEAINDSVFAIIGETFGFIGLMVILFLFTVLLLRLLKVMDHLVDVKFKLLVAGAFGWLASHVILNIAAMIGVLPLTGITLPLLSFGGTSMIFIAAVLGLVFQLSRYTTHVSRLKESSLDENPSGRRRVGRTRYASCRSTERN
jgi:cell division protein FtsW